MAKVKVDRRKKEIRFIENSTGSMVAYSRQFQGEGNKSKEYFYTKDDQCLGTLEQVQIDNDPVNMAMGTVVPRKNPTALRYLTEAREYNDETADIYEQVRLCNKLYLWEGIVGTAIDLQVDFSVTPITFQNVKDDRAMKNLEFWKNNVNRDNNNMQTGVLGLLREFALEWYTAGNVLPYMRWDFVRDRELGLRNPVQLPMSISLLNPLSIEIPDGPIEFGKKVIYLKVSDKLLQAVQPKNSLTNEDPEIELLRKYIGKNLRKKIDGSGRIILNTEEMSVDNVQHLRRKGRSYHGWGIPYLTKCFSAIASKKRLRALDDSTTDGLINTITIFKVGDKDNPKTWSAARLSRFAQLIRNPTSSLTVVWSYDVEVEMVGPQGDILSFDDKYSQADRDIKEGLGIPSALITGTGGGNIADVWVTTLALIERLEDFRTAAATYLNQVARQIMLQTGFDNEFPVVNWSNLKLRNERHVKEFIMGMFDRGLLSVKTSIQEAGFDYDQQLQYRKDEKRDKIEEIFTKPDLPFSSPSNVNNKKKPADPEKDQTVEKKGRPKGSKRDNKTFTPKG